MQCSGKNQNTIIREDAYLFGASNFVVQLKIKVIKLKSVLLFQEKINARYKMSAKANNVRINTIGKDDNLWNILLENPLSLIDNCKFSNFENKERRVNTNEDMQKRNLNNILNNLFGNNKGNDDETVATKDESIHRLSVNNNSTELCNMNENNTRDQRQNVSQILGKLFGQVDINDNDDADTGSVLLQDFPKRRRSQIKPFMSRFSNKERCLRGHSDNTNISCRSLGVSLMDPLDLTMTSGIVDPLDMSTMSTRSDISTQKVKHAMIDSAELEKLKKIVRPTLSTSCNHIREQAPENKQFHYETRRNAPSNMRTGSSLEGRYCEMHRNLKISYD